MFCEHFRGLFVSNSCQKVLKKPFENPCFDTGNDTGFDIGNDF